MDNLEGVRGIWFWDESRERNPYNLQFGGGSLLPISCGGEVVVSPSGGEVVVSCGGRVVVVVVLVAMMEV